MNLTGTKRKQAGQLDERLLDRIDHQAKILGQTRRVWLERAAEAALQAQEIQAVQEKVRRP